MPNNTNDIISYMYILISSIHAITSCMYILINILFQITEMFWNFSASYIVVLFHNYDMIAIKAYIAKHIYLSEFG